MKSYSNNESHTLNEVHVACPKAPCTTPPCMFHHRISHQPSSSPPKLEDNIAIFHSILNEAHVAHPKAPQTLPNRASSATAPPQSTAFNLRPPPPTPLLPIVKQLIHWVLTSRSGEWISRLDSPLSLLSLSVTVHQVNEQILLFQFNLVPVKVK